MKLVAINTKTWSPSRRAAWVLLCGVTWTVLWSSSGCGGRTLSSQDGDQGSLATCGDSCSPAQVASSCAAICDKLAQTSCGVSPGCGCTDLVAMLPTACLPTLYAFLRCVESCQPTCDASGAVWLGA